MSAKRNKQVWKANLIPFPGYPEANQKPDLVRCAWEFAHSVLWPFEHFPAREIQRTKKCLQEYFETPLQKERAFLRFCERVILTERYLSGQKSTSLTNPSIWLHPGNLFGFAGTKQWQQLVEQKRLEMPSYLEGHLILANGFLDFIKSPSNFRSCADKLGELHQYGLLQLFYNCVVAHTYYGS